MVACGSCPRSRIHPTGIRSARSADVRQAERQLFSSFKGEFEGFVDRYFNRKLSRWFTRIFLALGVSPNVITMVATLVGLLGGGGIWVRHLQCRGYCGAVVSTGGGHRLLRRRSRAPDVYRISVRRLARYRHGQRRAHGDLWSACRRALLAWDGQRSTWVPLALGVGGGSRQRFFRLRLVNRAQKIKTASEWKTPVHAAWSDFMLKNVASRDFSVVVLLFALFGKLEWFLGIAAIGSMMFALVMVWVIRPSAVVTAKA